MSKQAPRASADPFDAALAGIFSGSRPSPLQKRTAAKPAPSGTASAKPSPALVKRLAAYLGGLAPDKLDQVKASFAAAVAQIENDANDENDENDETDATGPNDEAVQQ